MWVSRDTTRERRPTTGKKHADGGAVVFHCRSRRPRSSCVFSSRWCVCVCVCRHVVCVVSFSLLLLLLPSSSSSCSLVSPPGKPSSTPTRRSAADDAPTAPPPPPPPPLCVCVVVVRHNCVSSERESRRRRRPTQNPPPTQPLRKRRRIGKSIITKGGESVWWAIMSRVARTASSFKKCRRRLFSLSLSFEKHSSSVCVLCLCDDA